jgi:hypothetical protein
MKTRDFAIIGCWLGGPNPSVMKPTAIVPLSFRRAVDLEHRATNEARRKDCRMRKKQSIFTKSFDRDKAPKKKAREALHTWYSAGTWLRKSEVATV